MGGKWNNKKTMAADSRNAALKISPDIAQKDAAANPLISALRLNSRLRRGDAMLRAVSYSPELQAYGTISQQERTEFLNMQPLERTAFLNMNSAERSAFLNLPDAERVFFLRLKPEERAALIGTTEQERSTFLGMDAGRRSCLKSNYDSIEMEGCADFALAPCGHLVTLKYLRDQMGAEMPPAGMAQSVAHATLRGRNTCPYCSTPVVGFVQLFFQ